MPRVTQMQNQEQLNQLLREMQNRAVVEPMPLPPPEQPDILEPLTLQTIADWRRMTNVKLGNIQGGYADLVDFRPPKIGEWFLQNTKNYNDIRVVKCTRKIFGNRLIFRNKEA